MAELRRDLRLAGRLGDLSPEATLRPDPGAGRNLRGRHRQPVRHPQARRHPPALRPQAAVRRRPEELGGHPWPEPRSRRPAPGRPRRGPPPRLRRLRGHHPARRVRCRRRHHLGPRPLGAAGREPGRKLPPRHAEVPPRRREAPRRLDAGAAETARGRARQLAADQGARRLRQARRRRRAAARGAGKRGLGQSGGSLHAAKGSPPPPVRRIVRSEQGPPCRRGSGRGGGSAAARVRSAATRLARGYGAGRRGVAARNQVRRLPDPRPHRPGPHPPVHPQRARLDRALRRPAGGLP